MQGGCTWFYRWHSSPPHNESTAFDTILFWGISSEDPPDFISSWKGNCRLLQRSSPQNTSDRIPPCCHWSKERCCRLHLNWKTQEHHENPAARVSSHTPTMPLGKTQIQKELCHCFHRNKPERWPDNCSVQQLSASDKEWTRTPGLHRQRKTSSGFQPGLTQIPLARSGSSTFMSSPTNPRQFPIRIYKYGGIGLCYCWKHFPESNVFRHSGQGFHFSIMKSSDPIKSGNYTHSLSIIKWKR